MKAISLAVQAIKCSDTGVVVAGGMEKNISSSHYYSARNATKLGDTKMTDGMVKDGLTDAYHKTHMGVSADKCAVDHNISREDQDNFAMKSYEAANAWEQGKFDNEVIPVEVPQRRGEPIIIQKDEEYSTLKWISFLSFAVFF